MTDSAVEIAHSMGKEAKSRVLSSVSGSQFLNAVLSLYSFYSFLAPAVNVAHKFGFFV